jgi:hypothetical protein
MTTIESDPEVAQAAQLPEVDPLSLDGDQLYQQIVASGLILNLGQITSRSPLDRLEIIERKLQNSGLFGCITIDIVSNEDETGIVASFRVRNDV